ncbi:ABC transporter substrate-binding protein [Streptomyces sp. NPDC020800]|uniref:ABC transporter substrate-binding protein n=1 Tax=Streptomyces sp. NPDC020800 TaxID=3365092 RepID=UPI0037B29960
MPDSATPMDSAPRYPRWSDRLIRQLDAFAATRSRAEKVPALVLNRQDGGDCRSPALMVREFEHRLSPVRGTSRFQVPHAVVDDRELTGGFLAAMDRVALRFQLTMPSGRLRLAAFHTCRAVLDSERGTGDLQAQQQPILDGLYTALLKRRKTLGACARVADFLGRHFLTGWLQGLVAALIVGFPKLCYRFYLRHWGLRWVAYESNATCFLDAALAFCQDGELDQDDPRVRRILLRALLTDLRKATRGRTWLSHLWARRRWSFVILIPEIDDVDGPGRTFLGTFEELAGDHPSRPLLILAACAGPPPDYAAPLGADPGRPNGTADKVFTFLNEGSTEPVRLVTLPAEDDTEGTTQKHPSVMARRDRPLDWLRPAVLPVLAVSTAGIVLAPHYLWPAPPPAPPEPPSCVTVKTGERVGITDGKRCDLAVPGDRGKELRDLERQVAEENARIPGGRYRTLVFLAPLSLQNGVYDDPPIGLQILRGAIAQQHRLNTAVRQNKMPIRLLIANTGQYFQYGSRDAGAPKSPDVAQMIINRERKDHIAAVIGITQSRPESLSAVRELDQAGIPVIANGVTGSNMVGPDSPQRYFQISAPNARVAPVLADFVRHSPAVRRLTGDTPPHAVVVYDPTDTYFSTDLRNLFVDAYRKHGDIDEITYSEKPGATTPDNIATDVCNKVTATHGIVVYLGRSGVLPSLLNAMQSAGGQCQPPEGTTIPLIAESAPIDFQLHPAQTARAYPYMTLFYETANAPTQDSRDPYAQFAQDFAAVFGSRSADADAAGGFDTVGIVTKVVENLLPASHDVQPNDIYLWLTAHGVSQYPGASGVLQLDGKHKYPPDKAVFIREIAQPHGATTTLLSCGILPNRQNPASWGAASDTFPCPRDDTASPTT